jgi:uncharacterized membrane protein
MSWARTIWTSHRKLVFALVAGLLAGLLAAFIPPSLPLQTSAILGWDVLCLAFLAQVLPSMAGRKSDDIRARAEGEDESRGVILLLVLAGSAASLGAVAAELGQAKGGVGLARWTAVGVGFGTVALSWLMVHVSFALHYAHEYYGPRPPVMSGGLGFPGGEEPDYWDFVHFAFVIGVASQTADVTFTHSRMRRLGTLHCVVAFAFNTVVVALTVNLLASLF